MSDEKLYRYSEIFHSIQGEGTYTGIPTAWLRFFNCNLQCDGFGQKDPKDSSTYVLPYKDFDVSKIETFEELPVWETGCDSSYSWSKKYRHLAPQGTVDEIASAVIAEITNRYNPHGKFGKMHMCFTGGEPLLKHAQECSSLVLKEWIERRNIPWKITYETNGTQALTDEFAKTYYEYVNVWGGEIFFSCSPKLESVSGEKASKAIDPYVVAQYNDIFRTGQLKFVINGTKDSWDEMEGVITKFKAHGIEWPVWVMPVGATVEGQELVAGDVAKEAYLRGYNVCARVHTYLWGNKIGV